MYFFMYLLCIFTTAHDTAAFSWHQATLLSKAELIFLLRIGILHTFLNILRSKD